MARILSCCAGAFREIAAGQLVEFADSLRVLGLPPGEALAPGDLGHRVERGEPGHPVGSRGVPVAPRAAGEDVLLVQGAEHRVDVAGHVRLAGARVPRLGRVVVRAGGDPRGRGLDYGGLMLGEEVKGCGLRLARRGAGGEPGRDGDGGDDRAAARASGWHGSLLIMGSW